MTHHLDELMRQVIALGELKFAPGWLADREQLVAEAESALRTAIAEALSDAHAEGMDAAMVILREEMADNAKALDEARTEMAAECATLGWRTPLDARELPPFRFACDACGAVLVEGDGVSARRLFIGPSFACECGGKVLRSEPAPTPPATAGKEQ